MQLLRTSGDLTRNWSPNIQKSTVSATSVTNSTYCARTPDVRRSYVSTDSYFFSDATAMYIMKELEQIKVLRGLLRV